MKHDRPIAAQIVDLIQADGLEAGVHLPAQRLADRLRVSRSPVNEALALLHEKGILMRETNRGDFVARAVTAPATAVASALGLDETDLVSRAYFQVADDRLRGRLPDPFSEQMIRTRYGLTPTQLNAVLGCIAQEGWAERKPGYGWAFSAMLTTPDSLLQSYRLRLALEPAALLEPGYRLDARVIERLRAAEHHLLAGGIETDTADQLHDRGVRFPNRWWRRRATRSSSILSGASTGSGACCRTARCSTASAIRNTPASTSTSSTCSRASATKRPRT
uniref:HTH gntR-type domain-containing protein n=1 Tax=Ralstonia solanacearum TaxID=305 RepID=A0A0S4WBN7_RALSL|nr:protein of unknown function [Ralstonia solanacearum]